MVYPLSGCGLKTGIPTAIRTAVPTAIPTVTYVGRSVAWLGCWPNDRYQNHGHCNGDINGQYVGRSVGRLRCFRGCPGSYLALALEGGELVHEEQFVEELAGLDELQQVEQLVHLSCYYISDVSCYLMSYRVTSRQVLHESYCTVLYMYRVLSYRIASWRTAQPSSTWYHTIRY